MRDTRFDDPLNDVENLRDAAEAIVAAGRRFDAGMLYGSHRYDALADAARRLPELGAARILLHDPAGLLQPGRAGELTAELAELSGLPVGLYCQGAGRNALAIALEAARRGADLISVAVYPVALATHRVSAETAAQAFEKSSKYSGRCSTRRFGWRPRSARQPSPQMRTRSPARASPIISSARPCS